MDRLSSRIWLVVVVVRSLCAASQEWFRKCPKVRLRRRLATSGRKIRPPWRVAIRSWWTLESRLIAHETKLLVGSLTYRSIKETADLALANRLPSCQCIVSPALTRVRPGRSVRCALKKCDRRRGVDHSLTFATESGAVRGRLLGARW